MNGDHEELNTMVTAERTKPVPGLSRAIVVGSFHGLMWFALLALLCLYVPKYWIMFMDFELELPVMTEWVFVCTHYSLKYWYFLIPGLTLLSGVDTVILCALYLHPKTVVLRRLWIGFMVLLPLGCIACTVVAVRIPMSRLIESLE